MSLQFRHNTKNGPESELVSRTLSSGLPFKSKYGLRLFQEPSLPVGYPDIVAVCTSRPTEQSSSRTSLSIDHLRILHHLYRSRSSTIADLSTKLLFPTKIANKIVRDLLDAEVVYLRGETISIKALSKIFTVSKIIAIEAKIQNWKCAIFQAATNSWFASHSYILLPPRRNLSEVCEQAGKFGVGVLVFDANECCIASNPVEKKIPASYGSWLFNEQIAQRQAL